VNHRSTTTVVSSRLARRAVAVAVCATCAVGYAGPVLAFDFDTGIADLTVRWDNTLRLNYATRANERNSKFSNTAIADEGTWSFDKGDAVAQRVDLLTELDVVYRKRHGFRVSAAGWYDAAYGDESRTNPNLPFRNIPSYVNRQYSSTVKRFYQGPSGEVLDAFVFTGFDAGSVPVSLKAGSHTIYWGESLFLNGNLNGIAYAQNPLDLQKGFATPGTEAKELFRPLNQISGQAQVTDTLSVAAQVMLEWDSFRYPEGGTYLGPVDFAFNGPDRQFLGAPLNTFAMRGDPSKPKNTGEWGLAARWSPDWLDGTLGFYYRNFADKLPQSFITRVPPAGAPRYNLIYADDIDLFGVSLAKNIAGVSVGAEVSYRHNTPLNSQILGIAPGLPAEGETKGPRGNTYHWLVNGLGVVPKTAMFDSATYAAELTGAYWSDVTSGANLFNAVGYAPCAGRTKMDGCTTKTYWGLALAFTPVWYQAFAGVDLSAPLTYSRGISGNAPTVFGGNERNGTYTIGLGADVFQKYRFDFKYIDYFGQYKDNGVAVTTQNGFTTLLKDRGFYSLTFKMTI
jgi:hypothetical protein